MGEKRVKTVFEKAITLTEKDHQTNVKLPFVVENPASKLIVNFQYTPKHAEDQQAYSKVEQALSKYVPQEEQKKWGTVTRYLPLENLVTISLSYEDEYIGAHHNKATTQEAIISPAFSSKGFLKKAIEPGCWELQLNVHCVASRKIEVSVAIRLEEEEG
jgi:hypothetical protein